MIVIYEPQNLAAYTRAEYFVDVSFPEVRVYSNTFMHSTDLNIAKNFNDSNLTARQKKAENYK